MNQSVKEPGVYMHHVMSFVLQTNPHKRLSTQSHKWLQELLYSLDKQTFRDDSMCIRFAMLFNNFRLACEPSYSLPWSHT